MISDENSGQLTSLIRIKIQNVFTSVLMDSGSSKSAIDFEYAQKIGVKIEPLEVGETKFLQTANQTRVNVQGKCTLELQIHAAKLNFEFFVIRDLTQSTKNIFLTIKNH